MWLTLSATLTLLGCLAHTHKPPFRNLEDLQVSYWKAYPEKQIRPYYENLTIRPNINLRKVHLESEMRCEKLSEFSLEQFQKLKENLGENELLKGTIAEMIYQPRARAYSGEWYNGKYLSEYYHSAGTGLGGCYNFKSPKPFNKKVQTWGKCVRLFRNRICQGLSLAIYPGSRIPNGRLKELKFSEIKSIGPCLSNEFHSSSFKNTNVTEIQKNPQFKSYNPDLFDLTQHDNLKSPRVKLFPQEIPTGHHLLETHSNPQYKSYNPVLFGLNQFSKLYNPNAKSFLKGAPAGIYLLGQQGRLEIFKTVIPYGNFNFSHNLITWKNITHDTWGMEDYDDVFIYAIPPNLGGPTNESYNLFLGSRRSARQWGEVFSHFMSFPNPQKLLWIVLTFVYEKGARRPLYFYYHAHGPAFISYGRILNEHNILVRNSSDLVDNFLGTGSCCGTVVDIPSVGTRLTKLLEKIIITKSPNSSHRNLNHKNEPPSFNLCKSQTFLSKYQNPPSSNNETGKFQAELGALRQMDLNPSVRLYSGDKYRGDFEEFSLVNQKTNGICYDLLTFREKNVRSLVVFGSCVRIFPLIECHGNSIPIYSQSSYGFGFENLKALSQNLSLIKSLGPCLPDESVDSFLKPGKWNPLQLSFTGQLEFFSTSKWKYSNSVSHGSILDVMLGYQNRTEFLYANIQPGNYLDFKPFNQHTFSTGFATEEGKLFSYAIPPFLNGPSNESFNIFETTAQAAEDWRSILMSIDITRNPIAILALNFIYENDTSTRPIWINFHVTDDLRGISYGRLWNGCTSNNYYANYSRTSWFGNLKEKQFYYSDIFF